MCERNRDPGRTTTVLVCDHAGLVINIFSLTGWIILHNTDHGWGAAIAFSNPDAGNHKIQGKMFPGKPTQADVDKLWDIVNTVRTHPPRVY